MRLADARSIDQHAQEGAGTESVNQTTRASVIAGGLENYVTKISLGLKETDDILPLLFFIEGIL